MSSQKELFTQGEGDRWFERNLSATTQVSDNDDPAIRLLSSIGIKPKRLLEIGCSGGDRLDLLRQTFAAKCYGIDPSSKAIQSGKSLYPELNLQQGTADQLPFEPGAFDTVIFGFCLYLCDRSDLFRIAAEADRCLEDGGILVITDFYTPFAYSNRYSHLEGLNSYKMDYAKMFLWNPAYTQIAQNVYSHAGFTNLHLPDERVATTVLLKDSQHAYPEAPFA